MCSLLPRTLERLRCSKAGPCLLELRARRRSHRHLAGIALRARHRRLTRGRRAGRRRGVGRCRPDGLNRGSVEEPSGKPSADLLDRCRALPAGYAARMKPCQHTGQPRHRWPARGQARQGWRSDRMRMQARRRARGIHPPRRRREDLRSLPAPGVVATGSLRLGSRWAGSSRRSAALSPGPRA